MATQFTYQGKTEKNRIVTGVIQAETENGVAETLRNQGITPITIKAAKKSTGLSMNIGPKDPKVKTKDRVVFTRQLATMVNAGVPIPRSLRSLAEQSDSKGLKHYLPIVVKDVESGISLGDALEKHEKAFDGIYVNMVRAGEAGGILDDVLEKLALQQEKDAKIRSKLKSAMTYPAVITLVTIGAFFFLMTTIVPQIGEIAISVGGDDYVPPLYTKLMLGFSGFLVNNLIFLIVGGLAGAVGLFKYIKSERGRPVFHKVLLKIPVVSTIITKVAVSRFSRIFSALSSAGVPIIESLTVTRNAINNAVMEEELNRAIENVRGGKPLSETLIGSKAFPAIVAQMMLVGEETGEISDVLVKIADFYEDDVERLADALASIIEPVMIIVLGGMVGMIAFSVFGPLSELSSNVK